MAGNWWEQPLVVLDLETTGLDKQADRIVQVFLAYVRPDGTRPDGTEFSELVQPGIPIPPGATAVHGITDSMAAAGMVMRDAVCEVCDWLEASADSDHPAVVFNAAFDLGFLAAGARRHGRELLLPAILDPLVIDRHCDRYRKGSRGLQAQAAHYGVTVAHQESKAAADALLAERILRRQAALYPAVRVPAVALQALQAAWAQEWQQERAQFRGGSATAEAWPV